MRRLLAQEAAQVAADPEDRAEAAAVRRQREALTRVSSDILVPRQLDPLDGSERIGDSGATIREFWSWAYSDLRSNTERGIFAEYLVARAVGDTSPLRKSWANHDVTTPSGIRAEVKTFGYLQSWHQKKLSTPSFGRLMARSWDDVTGESGAEPEVRADVFVFAIQTCRDPDAYDVLDLNQWEFRVLLAHVVRANPVKSVGMSFLDRHAPRRLTWHELAEEIEAAAHDPLRADDRSLLDRSK